MEKLIINNDAANAPEIFGLEQDDVKRLMPAIAAIYTRWENREMNVGGAIAEAVSLALNTQETGFCLMMVAGAIERARLMAAAVRVSNYTGPDNENPRLIIVPGQG